jgi:putative phosphoribosyl transferase
MRARAVFGHVEMGRTKVMAPEAMIPVGRDQVIVADVGGDADLATVVFAHGSGSSRHSPRNRQVAEVLQEAGFETVLLDLLTETEERRDLQTREHRFDIDLLSNRVGVGVDWLMAQGESGPIGLFGASTGAAAALRVAAAKSSEIGAVVSRGGRPDMAEDVLREVKAPTLLIVGGHDLEVLQLNEQALVELNAESSLEVIAGASHLFEEPGKLEQVADLATLWFRQHLVS